MRKDFLRRRIIPICTLLLIIALIIPLGLNAFAENSTTTKLFSDDYELYKGDTGESGTGPEADIVAISKNTPEDYRGKTIAVITGATTPLLMEEYYDDDVVLNYYELTSDMIEAMKTKKVDAYTLDNISFINHYKEDNNLAVVYPYLDTYGIKAFFPKNNERSSKLKAQYNEFLDKLRKADAFEKIFVTFLSDDVKELDMNFSGENGKISVAVCSSLGKPYCFYTNQQLNGYELYLITEFAKEYGYSVEFSDFNFAGMLAAVSSGKYDMGASATQSTYEREETIEFSDAEYFIHHVLIVERDDASSDGIIAAVKNSLYKTFVFDNRWKLFVKGILNTLLITVLAAIFGTLLGFVLYKMSVSGRLIPEKIAAGLAWLIRGMPTVVLLMILYYLIFSKGHIAGVWIAVIGFTLTFAVAMMGMISTGVGAIDEGQYEGAIALGYTKKQTFNHIIFPQAITHFMPLYSSEMIALIKATAIVGYIAVQDITKISDIVRSMTFEAFFPLIVAAILYFILGGILTSIVRFASKRLDNKERSKDSILKGVIVHD